MPLQTHKVSLRTGEYRLIAQRCPPQIEVEIQVFFQTLDPENPQRRSQKRLGKTSPEGLMVIVPFTELRPGWWELRISSPQMRELRGDSWQTILKLKVRPPEAVASIRPDLDDAIARSFPEPKPAPSSSPLTPTSPQVTAYQPIFSTVDPTETTAPEPILTTASVTDSVATEMMDAPEVELQPRVEPSIAPLKTPRSRPSPMSASEPNSKFYTQEDEITTLAVPPPQPEPDVVAPSHDPSMALTPEVLAEDAAGFEPSTNVPEPIAPSDESSDISGLDTPHTLLEQSIQSLEQILQQVGGVEAIATTPTTEPVVTPVAEPDDFEAIATSLPESVGSKLVPLNTITVAELPELTIALAQDTFIRHRDEPILISGHVEIWDGESGSILDQGFGGSLRYALRDPETQAELLAVEQPLHDATIPLVFNYLLDVPTAYVTRLLLGEVSLTITTPVILPENPTEADAEAVRPIAQQTFSITAGLDDLLNNLRQLPTPPVEPPPLPVLKLLDARSRKSPKGEGENEPSQNGHGTTRHPKVAKRKILPPTLTTSGDKNRKVVELPRFGNSPLAAQVGGDDPKPVSKFASPTIVEPTPKPETTPETISLDKSANETAHDVPLPEPKPQTSANPLSILPPDILAALNTNGTETSQVSEATSPPQNGHQPIPELELESLQLSSSPDSLAMTSNGEMPDAIPDPHTEIDPVHQAFESLQLGDRFLDRMSTLADVQAAKPITPPVEPAEDETSLQPEDEEPNNSPALPTELQTETDPETETDAIATEQSDWPIQEFVIDEEESGAIVGKDTLRYDASGLPYPQQLQNIDAFLSTPGETPGQSTPSTLVKSSPSTTAVPKQRQAPPPPIPELLLPSGELTAGDWVSVRVRLPLQKGLVYVKLWVKDCETRQLLDGPRAFVDFETIETGELETLTQVIVPLGPQAIRFEAITIDVTTGQESRKASCDRPVMPPELYHLNLDGFPQLPLSD